MSEDAPVNTGAVAWPDDFTASVVVRRMQAKLHRWAAGDPGRCFGDLFNLVYDPAFLVHAWERVSTNKGAQTPTHRWRSPSCRVSLALLGDGCLVGAGGGEDELGDGIQRYRGGVDHQVV